MIVLICGVGRAGKSTYSKRFESVIHFDLMGRMSERYENIINIIDGKDEVVVEGLYNHREHRMNLLKAYKGNKRVCVWMDTPKSIVIERMNKCGILVTSKHFDFQPPTLAEGWDEIIRITPTEIKKIYKG